MEAPGCGYVSVRIVGKIPSANAITKTTRSGHVYKPADAKAYMALVGRACESLEPLSKEFLDGEKEIDFSFFFAQRYRVRDTSNAVKLLEDALAQSLKYNDNTHIRVIATKRPAEGKDEFVDVVIRPYTNSERGEVVRTAKKGSALADDVRAVNKQILTLYKDNLSTEGIDAKDALLLANSAIRLLKDQVRIENEARTLEALDAINGSMDDAVRQAVLSNRVDLRDPEALKALAAHKAVEVRAEQGALPLETQDVIHITDVSL